MTRPMPKMHPYDFFQIIDDMQRRIRALEAIVTASRAPIYFRHGTFSGRSVPDSTETVTGGLTTVIEEGKYLDQTLWSGGAFTAPIKGVYLLSFTMTGVGTATSRIDMDIRINGNNFAGNTKNNEAPSPLSVSTTVDLNAGDVVDFAIYQTTGSTQTYAGDVVVAQLAIL